MKISNELKMKILTDMIVDGDFIPGPPNGLIGKLDLSSNEKLLEECKTYMNRLFNCTYDLPYKQDIGKYKALFPFEIDEFVVKFSIDYIDTNENWKDWFMLE